MNQPLPCTSNHRSLLSRESGYTLLEIMLVLGIIALLLSSAIYMMSGNLDFAQEQRVKSDLQAISMQLSLYEMQNFQMPTSEQGLDALVHMPTAAPKPQHWKKLWKDDNVPLDPWNRPYIYRNPGKYKTDGYDLYSLGREGKDGDTNNLGR